MIQADSVHSTPPTNTSALPVDPTRRRFINIAAGASIVSVGSLVAAAAVPNATPEVSSAPVDPVYAAIERHRAAGIVWDAAVGVRSNFPESSEPMTDEQWEQRDILDEALDEARCALDEAGVDLIRTEPTTAGGISSAIAYIQRQMRDDGTFMPFDIEFHYDVGYEGDSAAVLGWLDAFLNTIAGAVSELDPAPVVQL
jgi:hypothetical protein